MTISEFVKKHNITMTSVKVNQNPNMSDNNSKWSKTARHFEVTFTRIEKHAAKHLVTYFSMGSGIKEKYPKCSEVLQCLFTDSDAINLSFHDWCNDFGYDCDSISANKVYQNCFTIGFKLKEFLGNELFGELSECELD